MREVQVMDKEQLRQLKAELRRKYAEKGLEGLDSQEITALLLSYSEKDDFTQLAQTLTQDYGSFSSLADSDPYLLMNCGGVSEQTAVLLKAISRLAVVRSAEVSRFRTLKTANRAKEYFTSRFMGSTNEQLAAVTVNEKLRITSFGIITGGTGARIDSSCRSIIEFAINNNADYIFIAHNHPNSSPAPSESDISSTRRIDSVLESLDITLIDHIITGIGGAVSMRELNLLSGSASPGYSYRQKSSPFLHETGRILIFLYCFVVVLVCESVKSVRFSAVNTESFTMLNPLRSCASLLTVSRSIAV